MSSILKCPDDCFGCFACQDICPVGAITTVKNPDTFLYPLVNSTICINCGQCLSVCPCGKTSEMLNYPISCFAGIITDSADEKKSSSGGAFKAIVKACLNFYGEKYSSFYVAGCTWGKDFQAIHKVVQIVSESDIDQFSKSKYVQSYPCGVYQAAREIVEHPSNFLIFSGTPCQVAAIKRYLGKRYDNYLCVDLICHGVPSQTEFDEYRFGLEESYDVPLKNYEFKTKEVLENGTLYTRSVRYEFENGVVRRLSRLEDDYLRIFYGGTYKKRKSCENCVFKRPERVGDLTIGDAWGINELYPEVIPTKGCSAVILSERAKNLEGTIRSYMKTYEVSYNFIVEHNEPLRKRNG